MLHHATGFCAGVWRSIARQLAVDHVVFALDARGHGDSTRATGELSWHRYGMDLLEVSQAVLELSGAAAFAGVVGHSLGGTAALTAAAAAPGLFERVVLIEPVLIPRSGPGARRAGRTVFSATTRMRRARFESAALARRTLADQEPFNSFRADVLDDYVAHGLVDLEIGGVELKCAPRTEAAIYELGPTEVLLDLAAVTAPVCILEAIHGRFGPAYERLRRSTPRFEFLSIDAGHLAPMEIPAETARIIGDLLSRPL